MPTNKVIRAIMAALESFYQISTAVVCAARKCRPQTISSERLMDCDLGLMAADAKRVRRADFTAIDKNGSEAQTAYFLSRPARIQIILT
jgi:hypothetical protein